MLTGQSIGRSLPLEWTIKYREKERDHSSGFAFFDFLLQNEEISYIIVERKIASYGNDARSSEQLNRDHQSPIARQRRNAAISAVLCKSIQAALFQRSTGVSGEPQHSVHRQCNTMESQRTVCQIRRTRHHCIRRNAQPKCTAVFVRRFPDR